MSKTQSQTKLTRPVWHHSVHPTFWALLVTPSNFGAKSPWQLYLAYIYNWAISMCLRNRGWLGGLRRAHHFCFAVTHNTFQLSTFTEVLSVVQSQRLKQKRIFRKFLAKICVKTYLQTINFHVRSSPYNLLTPLISTAFSQPCILQYNVSPSRLKCTSFLRFHRIRMETSSMNSEGEILWGFPHLPWIGEWH